MANADMFKYGCMPHNLFGPVQILWKPQSEEEGDKTIWLRIHPSIFADVFANIASTLLLPEFQQHASSSSVPNPVLQLRDLRTEINSFEITGPRAGRVLKRILRLCKTEGKDKRDVGPAQCHQSDPSSLRVSKS
jgi:ribonuclease P/MRP protein subunit POP1